jgi:dihydroorotase
MRLSNLSLSNGEKVDLTISRGIIQSIDEASTAGDLNLDGLIALPGFVDLHTHLREPGFESSETVLTGSMAAASGGYTAVFAMANTQPVADNAGTVTQVFELGQQAGMVEVRPIGSVTKGLEGKELAALGSMVASKAKVKIFSDDGHCVSDAALMKTAMEYLKPLGGVIAQHAQEPTLTAGSQVNEGDISKITGLKGWPSSAEESIILRDALLSEQTGCPLHVCHVTSKLGVELIRWAKQRGFPVTAEVTPHHLLLTELNATNYDTTYKVNPPLRTTEDTEALVEGLVDGTIDVIGTDHAPHASDLKDKEWESAAFGMTGLEQAYQVAHKVLIASGQSSWTRLVEVLSSTPARIGGLENHGRIGSGSAANLTIVDPKKTTTVEGNRYSKSSNNPYVGMVFESAVVHTIFNGEFSYRDGEVVK